MTNTEKLILRVMTSEPFNPGEPIPFVSLMTGFKQLGGNVDLFALAIANLIAGGFITDESNTGVGRFRLTQTGSDAA